MEKLNIFTEHKPNFCIVSQTDLEPNRFKFLSEISDGARKKIWYRCDKRDFLYKQSKKHVDGEYTKEHVSEWLAKEIADTIEVPCVNIVLCENAILSEKMWYNIELKSFLDYSEELSYSFHLSNLQTYNVRTLLSEKNVYRDSIICMLLFDVLIGNSDRHPGNYLYSDAYGFYPLFDHGSSLCAYVREENIHDYFKDKMRFNALCDTKSKPVLRDNQKITHKQLLAILREQFPQEFNKFTKNLLNINLTDLNVPLCSEERNELLQRFLKKRVEWFYE